MRGATVADALLALALALGGCGGDEERGPPRRRADPKGDWGARAPGAASAPARRAAAQGAAGRALRARLDAGEVARRRRRPGAIGDPAARRSSSPRAGTLEDLEWSRWTTGGAEGSGTMTGVVCEPTCARGTTIAVPGDDPLSRPVGVPAGRFFDRARVEVESATTRPPASDLVAGGAVLSALAAAVERRARCGAAGGRGGRTAGTASGRSARGTSGTSTGPRPRRARRRAAARRPGRRRSRPACRCPTTSGRWASAPPAAPRGPPSAALTVLDPSRRCRRGATARREGRSIRGSGTPAPSRLSLCTDGSG